MTLPSSGALSLNQIHIEAGGTSGTTVGINDADVRALISKSAGTQMSFNEWYGASGSGGGGGGGSASVALTETGYLNDTWSSNVYRTSYSLNYTVQNATVTSGKRHVIIAFSYRPLSLGSSYNPATWLNACTLSFDGTTMDYVTNNAGYSAYNVTGVFEKTMDVGTGSKTISVSFPVNTYGGDGSYSILIFDDVNDVGGTFKGVGTTYSTSSRTLANTSNQVGTTNFPTGYTHFLKLALNNTSNSTNNWTWYKGSMEGAYTLMGAGDHGTNERNASYYRFSSGTMSQNIYGYFSGNTASNGAVAIGFTRGFK